MVLSETFLHKTNSTIFSSNPNHTCQSGVEELDVPILVDHVWDGRGGGKGRGRGGGAMRGFFRDVGQFFQLSGAGAVSMNVSLVVASFVVVWVPHRVSAFLPVFPITRRSSRGFRI